MMCVGCNTNPRKTIKIFFFFKNQVSHVTCHGSRVWCHVSQITCHLSHGTYGNSHILWYSPANYPHQVSKCHGLTAVRPRKLFLTLRKILRFVCANLFFSSSTSFTVFASWFTHIMWFLCDFCTLSCAKFNTEVLTAQKNLLLECLYLQGWGFSILAFYLKL